MNNQEDSAGESLKAACGRGTDMSKRQTIQRHKKEKKKKKKKKKKIITKKLSDRGKAIGSRRDERSKNLETCTNLYNQDTSRSKRGGTDPAKNIGTWERTLRDVGLPSPIWKA